MDVELEVVVAELEAGQGENHRLHHSISPSSDQVVATILLQIQQPIRDNSVDSSKRGEWCPQIGGLKCADATVAALGVAEKTLQFRPFPLAGLPRVEWGGALAEDVVHRSIYPAIKILFKL